MLNKKLEDEQIELNITITEVKNTLEGFNSTLDKVEEWIRDLEKTGNGTHPNRATKGKKNFKKWR